MVGILSRRLRLLGPIPEVPNVSASAPQEAIALQTMPVSSLTSTVTLTEVSGSFLPAFDISWQLR